MSAMKNTGTHKSKNPSLSKRRKPAQRDGANLNLSELQEIIKIVEDSQIGEVEIEQDGRKIRVSKTSGGTTFAFPQMMPGGLPHPALSQSSPDSKGTSFEEPVIETKTGKNVLEVRSPMVGTFYRAPAPDADPYVNMGDLVKPGQTLCIIEAMKLMNEIESEVSGKIVKVCVENAKPVEYNQLLFLVEP